MLLFLVSALQALYVSIRAARCFRSGGEQFWTGLAALTLSWGLIANLVSFGNAMTPGWWLGAQTTLSILFLAGCRFMGAPSFPLRAPVMWIPEKRQRLAAAFLIAALVTLLALLLRAQIAQPVREGDDLRYHGSRVLYWIGNQSIFPFDTHNDRQTVFGYQGELAFLWPVLFTRNETLGGLVFWLGVPLACLGVYLVARACRASILPAGFLTLLFLATPIVLHHGFGLKTEMWLTAYLLGTLWWALRAAELGSSDQPTYGHFFMAGIYAALAAHTKFNALAAAPVLVALPLIMRGVLRQRRSMLATGAGFLGGAMLNGLLVLLAFNTVREGGPLGSKEIRAIHAAELSVTQIRTHLARLPVLLLEPPAMPWAAGRAMIERVSQAWLHTVGADGSLPGERPDAWPGTFSTAVRASPEGFSLGGVLLLLALGLGLWSAVGEAAGSFPRIRISPYHAAILPVLSFFLAVSLLIRWMPHSGLPERFLIPCYAGALSLLPGLLYRPAAPLRWLPSLLRLRIAVPFAVVTVLAMMLYPAPRLLLTSNRVWNRRAVTGDMEGPYAMAIEHLPPGARILFFGSQYTPDYGLFGPREGYPRTVIPWGKAPFDEHRLRNVIQEKRITHVLFETEGVLSFHWAGVLDTRPFIEWLRRQSDTKPVALEPTGSTDDEVRLFTTPFAAQLPAARQPELRLTTSAPTGLPLIVVEESLRNDLGIDERSLRTPWPVEDPGGGESGFLWLGSGTAGGLQFRLWSQEGREVTLGLRLSAGPSRTDGTRTVKIRCVESGVETARQFTGTAEVWVPLRLAPALNTIRMEVAETPNVDALPKGDTRALMAGLHEVRVAAGPR